MTTDEAIANLQNLFKAALRSGMFDDPKAVEVIQESIETVKEQMVRKTWPPEGQKNGLTREDTKLPDEILKDQIKQPS